jgi:hypothetical protein
MVILQEDVYSSSLRQKNPLGQPFASTSCALLKTILVYPVVFALGNRAKRPNRDRNMALISTEDDEETDNLLDLKESLIK